MRGEDDVDRGRGVLDDRGERARSFATSSASVESVLALAGALVVLGHHDVGLAVARASVRRPATRLTASTGSPNSRSAMPAGVTAVVVSCVMTPMTPTVIPPTSKVLYSGSAGVVVPLR